MHTLVAFCFLPAFLVYTASQHERSFCSISLFNMKKGRTQVLGAMFKQKVPVHLF